jgi:hypothetical protein
MATRFSFVLLLLCSAVMFSPQASAALKSLDDATFGIGSITRDTASGLEWLDLTKSSGISYSYVSSRLGSGQEFDGWRHAASTDVGTFFDNAGGTGPYTGAYGSHQNWVPPLLALWGDNANFGGSGQGDSGGTRSLAILSDSAGSGSRWLTNIHYLDDLIRPSYAKIFNEFVADGYDQINIGHALIRDAPLSTVPIPAAVWLFGTALIGLVGFSKRRKET